MTHTHLDRRLPLDAIFSPRAVAVIGATEKSGSVGRAVLWNLIKQPFGGTVYPVNPSRPDVLGIRSYPGIAAVPEPVDLAVVVTPAPSVPSVIRECVSAGVQGAVIISAGFKEIGPEGTKLEQAILEEARRGRMRLIGPNCLGIMRPHQKLNVSFATQIARPGTVGFISQSGALCTAILDWSFQENVGFSAFISIGSMLDVGWGDLIDYLGDDPLTKCIVIDMGSIGDARSFLSAAREVALSKPIIAIKSGPAEAAATARALHLGVSIGSDEVLNVACQRVGVLRFNSIERAFDMADALAKQPRLRGPTLTDLQAVHETSRLPPWAETTPANCKSVLAIIAAARGEKRTVFTEVEAKQLLSAYGIPTADSMRPMAKLDGYELIIGSRLDSQFGPVLFFGAGGQLLEVFKNRALELPPLNRTLARRMMEQTRIFTALKEVSDRTPIDLAALEGLLVRFSHLVVEQPWIKEIDINPLLASPERLLALGARVIVHGPDVSEAEIPSPAIRPYPVQYIGPWTAKDGALLTLRPIRPEDEPLIAKFHGTLSERTVSRRYFHAMTLTARTAHERLTRICFVDYAREMVLVADRADSQTGEHEIVGVGRLSRVRGTNEAEFALVVSDGFQGRGLGTAFLDRLVTIGRNEKIDRIYGEILPENAEMKHICKKLGFRLTHNVGDPVITAAIDLV
jgi:succinyl-CoA synthetase alpha subunit/RimJ/RimL family protein N-acetyltransferase